MISIKKMIKNHIFVGSKKIRLLALPVEDDDDEDREVQYDDDGIYLFRRSFLYFLYLNR